MPTTYMPRVPGTPGVPGLGTRPVGTIRSCPHPSISTAGVVYTVYDDG